MVDDELLKILACPACKGDIEYLKDREVLKCIKCKRCYPVKNNIPVMLVEEATIED